MDIACKHGYGPNMQTEFTVDIIAISPIYCSKAMILRPNPSIKKNSEHVGKHECVFVGVCACVYKHRNGGVFKCFPVTFRTCSKNQNKMSNKHDFPILSLCTSGKIMYGIKILGT